MVLRHRAHHLHHSCTLLPRRSDLFHCQTGGYTRNGFVGIVLEIGKGMVRRKNLVGGKFPKAQHA